MAVPRPDEENRRPIFFSRNSFFTKLDDRSQDKPRGKFTLYLPEPRTGVRTALGVGGRIGNGGDRGGVRPLPSNCLRSGSERAN
ncbi:hypothetical protein HNY73_004443 [Argiope bruennichi]|uniref:Uncharacterized protein n=1 Tax=Argiope bruennichi TaxID=94029 RepID=A0A8T0FVX1_ARGBR|nr:hypothetical protein HNY73_004443 [Argiope bruennichi]